jgi:hypothetical protein
MMSKKRQFSIAEVADSEVVRDERFRFDRERFASKGQQRR